VEGNTLEKLRLTRFGLSGATLSGDIDSERTCEGNIVSGSEAALRIGSEKDIPSQRIFQRATLAPSGEEGVTFLATKVLAVAFRGTTANR
jgi:hypothetical protein